MGKIIKEPVEKFATHALKGIKFPILRPTLVSGGLGVGLGALGGFHRNKKTGKIKYNLRKGLSRGAESGAIFGGMTGARRFLTKKVGQKVLKRARKYIQNPLKNPTINKKFYRAVAKTSPIEAERKAARLGISSTNYQLRHGATPLLNLTNEQKAGVLGLQRKYGLRYIKGLQGRAASKSYSTPMFRAGVHDAKDYERIMWKFREVSDAPRAGLLEQRKFLKQN